LADSPENLDKLAPLFSPERIAASGKKLHEAAGELRLSIQPRITAELCLLELCRMDSVLEKENIIERIEKLETLLRNQEAVGGREVPAAKPSERKLPPGPEEAPQILSAAEKPAGAADELWAKALKELMERKKGYLYAYASKGRAASFAGGKLRLEFDDGHFLQKIKKREYHQLLEEILTQVAGSPVALEYDGQAAAPEDGAKKEAPPGAPTAGGEDWPPAVRDALAVFGGTVYIKNK
jgi:DNA polymerase-3 subunit gamma/tau